MKLNVTVCKLDKAVFYYIRNNQCEGILIAHVDDFLFGGTSFFLDNIIAKLHDLFVIGLVESSGMKYLGIDVIQSDDRISMSMDEYIEIVTAIDIIPDRATEKELLSTS